MNANIPNAGRVIRAARKAKKVSAAEIGSRMNPPVKASAVRAWERGQNKLKIEHIEQICEILQIDSSSFFEQEKCKVEYAFINLNDPVEKDVAEIQKFCQKMSDKQRKAVIAVASAMVD